MPPKKVLYLSDDESSGYSEDECDDVEAPNEPQCEASSPHESPVDAAPQTKKPARQLQQYSCPYCSKSYKLQPYLKSHMEKCPVIVKQKLDEYHNIKTTDKKAVVRAQKAAQYQSKKAALEASRPVEVVKQKRGPKPAAKRVVQSESEEEEEEEPVVVKRAPSTRVRKPAKKQVYISSDADESDDEDYIPPKRGKPVPQEHYFPFQF